MSIDPAKYIEAGSPPHGATLKAHRLLRCPNTGRADWCYSGCAYSTHASPWEVLRSGSAADVDGFLRELRDDLSRGENHNIDVSRYDSRSFDGWRWIDRGYDLDTPEQQDAWIEHLRTLLTSNLRLRLYGDDHDVKAEIAAAALR